MRKQLIRVISLMMILCVGIIVVAGCNSKNGNLSKFNAVKSEKVESQKSWDQAIDSTSTAIEKENYTLYMYRAETTENSAYYQNVTVQSTKTAWHIVMNVTMEGYEKGSYTMEAYGENDDKGYVYCKNVSGKWVKEKYEDSDFSASTLSGYLGYFASINSLKSLYKVNDEVISFNSKQKGYVDETKVSDKTWRTTVVKIKNDMVKSVLVETESTGTNSSKTTMAATIDKVGSTKVSLPKA